MCQCGIFWASALGWSLSYADSWCVSRQFMLPGSPSAPALLLAAAPTVLLEAWGRALHFQSSITEDHPGKKLHDPSRQSEISGFSGKGLTTLCMLGSSQARSTLKLPCCHSCALTQMELKQDFPWPVSKFLLSSNSWLWVSAAVTYRSAWIPSHMWGNRVGSRLTVTTCWSVSGGKSNSEATWGLRAKPYSRRVTVL